MVSPAQIYRAIQPMMKTAEPQDISQTLARILELFPDFAQGSWRLIISPIKKTWRIFSTWNSNRLKRRCRSMSGCWN